MGATHGKDAAVYINNANGFVGAGLNDLAFGAYSVPSDSSYFEIEIDGNGAPDTFRWRENGGAWTEGVEITGAAQSLAGANGTQAITFAATTGHTIGDKWVIGNLYAEPCTESGSQAQITDTAMRLLNPDVIVVFTDSGGANVLRIDYSRGIAYFDAAVGTVIVEADNGFIPADALEIAAYLYDWQFAADVNFADKTTFGANWKSWLAGLADAKGSVQGFFASRKWFDRLATTPGAKFITKLFTYDPDRDGTGDHFYGWVEFSGFSLTAQLETIVNEKIDFQFFGAPAFAVAT